ncbi:F0F1 ATP synthase subunit B [Actinomyces sp. zg-332]|uniref:F0F1 ATP synthase subunit B n=1 Tax=Actinomyces sp. zg-332 TaxID=2708340 RepID=UPI001420A26C|nr:F0F1 ATP synthase subunit B [Actinomyces sp. zg-332]QPK94501.1 F0F1 ATP synthase subunit B [Actinomyces sp. zg-332]
MFTYLLLPLSSGHNILLPTVPDMVYSLICMAVLALVLRKVLPKFNSVIQERTEKIEAGINASKVAKEEVAIVKRELEEEKIRSFEEATQIREKAHTDARNIIDSAKAQAKLEAERIIEAAQRQIQSEYQLSQISLRSEVGMLACELADKIVGEHLQNEELSARVIDRFLDDLERIPSKKES